MNTKRVVWFVLAAAIASRASAQPATPATPPTGDAAADDAADAAEQIILPVRLLDLPPFDRITLNEANQNAKIETVLLDLPDRVIPDPMPQTGSLELYQLSQPSIPYAVNWSDIAKIELYEQMLLAEAKRLTAAGEFGEAFDYYAFLQTNYPKLPGLSEALDQHLWRDAAASFTSGDLDGAWPALLALYDRNPDFPRLLNAVERVSDTLIAARLQAHDYAAARAALDLVERYFPRLKLTNIARWREKLAADAEEQLSAARSALAAGNFDAARAAALIAEAIAPDLDEPRSLLKQIQAAAPEFRVGVMQIGHAANLNVTPDWAAARVADVVNPSLVRMIDFGSEGGVYESPFGKLSTSDSGLETRLQLSASAPKGGVAADAVALRLVDMANRDHPGAREDLAAALVRADVVEGRDVRLTWRQPHLHAEAFLQAPLRALTDAKTSPGLWFELRHDVADAIGPPEVRYERTGPPEQTGNGPHFVVERLFDDDDDALAALARGEIDALDRVPPWQLAQARETPDVVVEQYALPTVHVLVPNFKSPLLATREFRRALAYAIDCQSIVRDIFLGGDEAPGFTPLSGPFPIGVSLNDPVGYGYNSDLAPRPYEPRLAALLAGVARATVAKRELDDRKARGEKLEEPDPTKEPVTPPPKPLVLMHPADALARLACQSLKLQLESVGIPIKLVEAPRDGFDESSNGDLPYDLLYAELAVWEPLTDARRLLGPRGVAGRSSALMTAALDELDRSQNWNEARTRLRVIHRIAYYDLPLIPLWQTVNHFAHRTWLTGLGDHPLALYQNLDDWRKDFAGSGLGGRP